MTASLRSRLETLRGPSIAKAKAACRDSSTFRAALSFRHALDALEWSNREVARRLDVDERTVRDWCSGARALPAWVLHSLPRDAQLAYLYTWLNDVPPESRSGTDG